MQTETNTYHLQETQTLITYSKRRECIRGGLGCLVPFMALIYFLRAW